MGGIGWWGTVLVKRDCNSYLTQCTGSKLDIKEKCIDYEDVMARNPAGDVAIQYYKSVFVPTLQSAEEGLIFSGWPHHPLGSSP